MAIAIGQRFVRRQDAARSSTSNTTAADIPYDTAVMSEGGYGAWGAGETDTVRVDTAGKYLWIGDLGRVDNASTRAVGTIVPVVDGVTQEPVGMGTHRFLRNFGGAQEAASIGFGILDLGVDADVGVRNPGAILSIDVLGNYGTDASFGGACQLMRLPDGDFLHLERSADQAITQSNINTTRPWINSSGTWTKLTWPTETSDDGAWHAANSGDVVLPANSKFLIVWATSCYSAFSNRMAFITRLSIGGTIVQSGSGYQRNNASQGPPTTGMYLHETGGSTETLFLEATQESETNASETPQFADGALQIIELPSSTEWIHVDNSTTDTMTAGLATIDAFEATPLSSTFRADGGSNLSLDGANDAVQNDSGGTLGVLAIGWHRWDRNAGTSDVRKTPWTRFVNGGTAVGYGVASAYSRGAVTSDNWDEWQAHFCAVALLDVANAADLTFEVADPTSTGNEDMGIFASTNRHFLGVQVLDIGSMVSVGQTVTIGAATETEIASAITALKPINVPILAATETESAQVITPVIRDVIVLPTNAETTKWNRDSNPGSLIFSKPSGVLADDYLLIIAVKDDDASNFNTPDLWTQIEQFVDGNGDAATVGAWYIKEADQLGNTLLSIDGADASEEACGIILTVTGADQATFIDVAATTFSHENANSPNPPSVTTNTDFAKVIAITANRTNSGTIEETGGVLDTTPPAGYVIESAASVSTPATDAEVGPGRSIFGTGVGDAQLTWAHKQVDTAGLEDPGAFGSFINLRDHKLFTFAIKPVVLEQTITIGVATETEVASAITAVKPILKSIGVVSETEIAQSILASKPIITPINNAVEVEVVGVVSPVKPISVQIGSGVEVEVAGVIAPVKPISIPVNATTETEIAQGISAVKSSLVGGVVEVETPGVITPVKPITQQVNVATETEVAGVITPVKPITKPINATVEVEVAGVVVPVKPIITPVSASVETESAQLVTPVKPISVPVSATVETEAVQVIAPVKAAVVNAITETELARIIVPVKPITVPVASVTESELSQPILPIKISAISSVTETETPQVIAAVKPIITPVGDVTESETSQIIAPVKPINVLVTAVTETELAQTIDPLQSIIITIAAATETELPNVIAPVKPINVSIASATETELAQVIAPVKAIVVTINSATEIDAPQAIVALKPIFVSIAGVTETELARVISPLKPIAVTIGASIETEASQIIVPAIGVPIGTTTETELAQIILASKPIFQAVGVATETELAQIIAASKPKIVPVGAAIETETAQVIAVLTAQIIALGTATETELAQIITAIKPIINAIGAATEVEIAQVITAVTTQIISIGSSIETELAQIIATVKFASIVTATELELAQIIGAPAPPIFDVNNPIRIFDGVVTRLYVDSNRVLTTLDADRVLSATDRVLSDLDRDYAE